MLLENYCDLDMFPKGSHVTDYGGTMGGGTTSRGAEHGRVSLGCWKQALKVECRILGLSLSLFLLLSSREVGSFLCLMLLTAERLSRGSK